VAAIVFVGGAVLAEEGEAMVVARMRRAERE
jgi:hypothetical protein